ncbi:hypothetical protein SAMN05421810_108157 [Amycolatopsis arida]|uniref:Uncharacterized protein n=1 Tax=Amycolatopsis arida TaxID=587909 RepID=A0A1I5Z2K4_9PSEU|nr:hypothetical protein [Amycolatopsis arida]TDX90069.1 hypothetical protein CLV69_108157 [Amycolatopsis arida]SFQ50672.1 hypothetical protein SAMN05421810_108157 [Amycolatopsis arida]
MPALVGGEVAAIAVVAAGLAVLVRRGGPGLAGRVAGHLLLATFAGTVLVAAAALALAPPLTVADAVSLVLLGAAGTPLLARRLRPRAVPLVLTGLVVAATVTIVVGWSDLLLPSRSWSRCWPDGCSRCA